MQIQQPSTNKEYHVIIEKQPKAKEFLGVEYDTITLMLGFVVPLISFVFGFWFSTLRDKIKERRELKISSETLILWIRKSIESCNTLLEEIEKKHQEMLRLDNFQYSRPTQINLHLSRS